MTTRAADSAPPTSMASMAHTAVSLRNGRGVGRNGTGKGRTSVAISTWDEGKARSVDTWAGGLQTGCVGEVGAGRGRDLRDAREMRFGNFGVGVGRLSGSVGDNGHRENNGVKRGRSEAAGLEHPDLQFWSSSTSTGIGGRDSLKTAEGNGQTNGHTHIQQNPPPRGLPNTIPSRFTSSLSASNQRRDISKASSTRSSVPVLVVPYTPSSVGSPTSRFSFSSLSAPRIPKSIYKMRSSGPPPSLPPVSEFTFDSIMEWAKHDDEVSGARGVAADLERIAEICARSRLSLANQYERHMPPHGVGDAWGEPGEGRIAVAQGPAQRRRGKGRSKAFETLETINASSSSEGSSREGKGRGKSAVEVAGGVREGEGDGSKVREEGGLVDRERDVGEGGRGHGNVRREGLVVGARHARVGRDGNRRRRLAAVVIDTALPHDGSHASSRRLISKPLKPRTTNVQMGVNTMVEAVAIHEQLHNTETITPHQPHIPLLAPEEPLATIPLLHQEPAQENSVPSQSVLGTFPTWLPWMRQPTPSVAEVPDEVYTKTYFEVLPSAEGSLKRLLDASEKRKRTRGERNREAG